MFIHTLIHNHTQNIFTDYFIPDAVYAWDSWRKSL